MTYVDVGAAIETVLGTISELNIVYEYEAKQLKKYPAATVSASSHTDVFNDTASNLRTFVFTIRLYYRTDTDEDAESILRELTDRVIVAIETDTTLASTADFTLPTEGRWLFIEREVPVRVVELTVQAVIHIAR